jgi:hypothetical protein
MSNGPGVPDREYISLLETALNSRIFTGTIGVSLVPLDMQSNFGSLFIINGPPSTTVSFVYQDQSGGSQISRARLQYQGQINMSSTVPGPIRVGSFVYVTVTDGDANLDPNQVGSVPVTFRSSLDPEEAESLDLIEIEKNSGIFTGIIRTELGVPKKNQLINVQMPVSQPSSSVIVTVNFSFL